MAENAITHQYSCSFFVPGHRAQLQFQVLLRLAVALCLAAAQGNVSEVSAQLLELAHV